jgi:hypothetical protein
MVHDRVVGCLRPPPKRLAATFGSTQAIPCYPDDLNLTTLLQVRFHTYVSGPLTNTSFYISDAPQTNGPCMHHDQEEPAHLMSHHTYPKKCRAEERDIPATVHYKTSNTRSVCPMDCTSAQLSALNPPHPACPDQLGLVGAAAVVGMGRDET